MSRVLRRYVAIGDSTTEGLDDPDGRGGYRGWADRLAQRLADVAGEIEYANLAVRGLVTREIRERQLGPALALRPDVTTVVAGMNDLLRPDFDLPALEADLLAMHRAFVAQGAIVLTFTLPNLRQVMPLSVLFDRRRQAYNQLVRDVCRRSGARLVDVDRHAVGADPRLWSEDRLHANSEGHARMAEGLAQALGLPGAGDDWSSPLPVLPPPTWTERMRAEASWSRRYLLPWVARHLQRRSSGDGLTPKRPTLEAWRRSEAVGPAGFEPATKRL